MTVNVSTKAQANNTTLATSFSVRPNTGDTVIVLVGHYGVTTIAASDNQGVSNVYTEVPNASFKPASNVCGASLLICPVIGNASGTFTVTVTATGPGSVYLSICAISLSGLLASPNDQGSSHGNASASTSLVQTNSGANANASDLVVGIVSVDDGGLSNAAINDPPSGYTSIFVYQDASLQPAAEGCYKIVSAVETSSVTWTYTSTSAGPSTAGALATFKFAAAASGPPQLPLTGVG